MSKSFEKVQEELSKLGNNALNQVQTAQTVQSRIDTQNGITRANVVEQLKKDKLLLETLGVISLFQELIDNRVVVLSDKPVTKKEPVYKNVLLKGKIIDYHKNVKVSEYTPAYMIVSENGDYFPEQHPTMEASLHFHEHPVGDGQYESTSHDEINIVVANGNLCLIEDKGYKKLVPIKEGELEIIVAREIARIQGPLNFAR